MSPRPFYLMVDSGNRDEPPVRYFGSLEAAKRAAEELPAQWWPFVWITEHVEGARAIVHMRDGRDQSDA